MRVARGEPGFFAAANIVADARYRSAFINGELGPPNGTASPRRHGPQLSGNIEDNNFARKERAATRAAARISANDREAG
jgi:hypothetical protein